MTPAVAPPFDPHARDRIEHVATALLELVGRLEARIVTLERQVIDMEEALMQLGMVQVPR